MQLINFEGLKVMNPPNKILCTKAGNKGIYIDGLIVMLVLLWICFLLFTADNVQPVEQVALIQAYVKNLGLLLKDKVHFFV